MGATPTRVIKCKIARELRAGFEVRDIAIRYGKTVKYVSDIKNQISKDPLKFLIP